MKTTTRRLALALLILSLSAAAGSGQEASGVRRISIPGEKWALEVSLPGFVVAGDDLRPDGRGRRVMAGIEEKGYVVSIFLEPVPRGESAAELRDWDASGHKKSPLKPTDFKSAEYKQIPTLEYTIREFRGLKVNQKHFNAYVVHNGFWAHVHLSKVDFRPGDEKLFYDIVDSLKFTPGERMPDAATGDSFKRFMKDEKFLAALRESKP